MCEFECEGGIAAGKRRFLALPCGSGDFGEVPELEFCRVRDEGVELRVEFPRKERRASDVEMRARKVGITRVLTGVDQTDGASGPRLKHCDQCQSFLQEEHPERTCTHTLT